MSIRGLDQKWSYFRHSGLGDNERGQGLSIYKYMLDSSFTSGHEAITGATNLKGHLVEVSDSITIETLTVLLTINPIGSRIGTSEPGMVANTFIPSTLEAEQVGLRRDPG